jgi:hypothetical protein
MENVFLHSTEFVDCVFSGVMRGAVFYGRVVGIDAEFTSRRVNEISGNDFSAMKLSDVCFRQGVDLRLQKLPVGENYFYLESAERKLAEVRRKYVEHPATKLRKDVLFYLDSRLQEAIEGQRDMFLCRDSATYLNDATIKNLWKELAEVPA